MPIRINYYVLRFKVTVQYLLRMEVRNGSQSFKEVKLGFVFLHPFDLAEKVEEFSSVAELHAEDEIVVGFKAHEELGDERVPRASFEDVSLVFDNVLFFVVDDEILGDGFESHEFPVPPAEVYS